MRELDYMNMRYDVFKMFSEQWGLAAAGDSTKDWNALTIAWGTLGSVWSRPTGPRSIVTIFVSPSRYTYEFLEKSDVFTVSFFPASFRQDLSYLGSHSGRDEDKFAHTKITPIDTDPGVGFNEAELTFVCKKIYSDPFDGARAPKDIQDRLYTKVVPHHYYIGEIEKVLGE